MRPLRLLKLEGASRAPFESPDRIGDMILVRGSGGGTELTPGRCSSAVRNPPYKGAPDEDAPYVWVCDSFYEVESGGSALLVDGEEIPSRVRGTDAARVRHPRSGSVCGEKNTSEPSSPELASTPTASRLK